MTEINTLQQAERYAAERGYILTPEDRLAIAEAQRMERDRRASLETSTARQPLIAAFNKHYPRLLKFLNGIGEVILTLSQTLIVSVGVPVVLLLLMVVEQQRVTHGIGLFEVDPALAGFAATALVLLNLTLEFTIEHIEHKAGYTPPPDARFSLRTWWQSMAYMLGAGAWEPQALSPAQRYRKLLRLVTFSILALALAGSMRTVISSINGAWYVALGRIVGESSLSEIATWIGGLLFAAAAVLSAQGLSRYVAIRCVEILAGMTHQTDAETANDSAAIDGVAVQYIVARVRQHNAEQRNRPVMAISPSVSVLSEQTDAQTSVSKALSKPLQALQRLHADPSLAERTTRELEALTGINKSAWSEALRMFADEQETKPSPAVNEWKAEHQQEVTSS